MEAHLFIFFVWYIEPCSKLCACLQIHQQVLLKYRLHNSINNFNPINIYIVSCTIKVDNLGLASLANEKENLS